MSVPVFVFYKSTPGGPDWDWPKLPKGWTWTGRGSTLPLNWVGPMPPYTQEEEFMGPRETRTEARKALEACMAELKRKNIVIRYAIRNSSDLISKQLKNGKYVP